MKILQKDNYHLKYNFKAFTLAEMLIVIFVFLAIGSLFFYRFLNISLDYNYLKTDMEIIQEVLMKAKQKSILAENNLSWGVYFENTTTDKFYLFWGNKFSTSSIFEQYLLNSNNKFISPQEGSSTEVVFSKFSGYFNSTTQIVLSNKKNTITATITINYFGNVDYSIK